MEIRTKFDIGQEVWVMRCNCPKMGTVRRIKVAEIYGNIFGDYQFSGHHKYEVHLTGRNLSDDGEIVSFLEPELYASKRELLESFLSEGETL